MILPPVKAPKRESDLLQEVLEHFFRDEIFIPLLKGEKLGDVLNASMEGLRAALSSGRLTFSKGVFSGRFDSKLSRELRTLGAKWDFSDKVFRLNSDQLPQELKSAIVLSESAFKKRLASLSSKLDSVLEKSPWEGLKFENLFKTAAFKTDSDFRTNVKKLGIRPQLSDFEAVQIGRQYSHNLKIKIKDFSKEQIEELRGRIKATYFSGDRYGQLKKIIEDTYEVSTRKAEFLARQETNLLTAAYQGSKYVEAGAPYYLWRAVKGTPEHPTRHRHAELSRMSDNGIIFRWDDPPVTTEDDQPDRQNNPKQDFNCRCDAFPVIIPAGAKVIKLSDHRYKIQAA